MKQNNYLGVLLLAVLVTGCKQIKDTGSVEPVKVKTITMKTVAVSREQGFSGTIEENTGATLSFPVGGTVSKMVVTVGQRVGKGTLVGTIDEITLQNAYNASSAMLAQAEDAYQRMKLLHDNGSLPEIQWVEVQSKLKQAVASEQIAKKSLNDSRLYAPFSGIISEKYLETGQNVLPGMPVAKLVTIDQVKVKVAVPENEIAHVEVGQAVRIVVAALGNKIFEGRIVEKGVVADALSRSYEIRALVNNAKQELMPGMICELKIDKEGEVSKEVFLLPLQVVQLNENNGSFVWVVNNDSAERREVRTGTLTNRGVVIEHGLTVGDEVIIEGQQKVSEHTQVVTEK